MKMQTFRKPHQWLNFWLEKYTEALNKVHLDADTRKIYWRILKEFLEVLPGNPRNITLDSISEFIRANPEERLIPVTLFYQHVSPSAPHLDLLKKLQKEPGTQTAAEDDPLQQFRTVLWARHLSERTVSSYCNSVKAYLVWLEHPADIANSDQVEVYTAYLAEEKKLSQRTIALRTAALRIYYRDVLAAPTGKLLPSE